jgi:hypothetical protein
MERVSISNGELPVLLVAPHGVDDINTDYIVDKIAHEMGLFSVINRGWKRAKNFDYAKDRANCNDIRHIHQDVIKEEFLDPIIRMVARIQKTLDERVFIFYIHGCSDEVREKAEDKNLDIILGYGEGSPPSHTFNLEMKNAFAYFLEKESFGVYQGKKGGLFSGYSKNNLNQLFRSSAYLNKNVNAMQLEIVNQLRTENELLDITCDGLINAIDELIMYDDATKVPDIKLKSI